MPTADFNTFQLLTRNNIFITSNGVSYSLTGQIIYKFWSKIFPGNVFAYRPMEKDSARRPMQIDCVLANNAH